MLQLGKLGQCSIYCFVIKWKIQKIPFISGSGFGLSLIVNIEQYEYIEGDNLDAGIKVKLKIA